MTTKICTTCGQAKPLDAFRLATRGGRAPMLRSQCRDCLADSDRARRQRQADAKAALMQVGPPPCDSCCQASYCARTRLECRGFIAYVETGRTPLPSPTGWVMS